MGTNVEVQEITSFIKVGETEKMRRLIQIHSILILPLVVAFAEKLPNNLVPLAYQLQVVTNLADEDGFFNFTGTVVISVSLNFVEFLFYEYILSYLGSPTDSLDKMHLSH